MSDVEPSENAWLTLLPWIPRVWTETWFAEGSSSSPFEYVSNSIATLARLNLDE